MRIRSLTAARSLGYKPRNTETSRSRTSTLMSTHSTKTADIQKKWILIDATGLVVGRLAVDHRHAAARQAQAELHPAHG